MADDERLYQEESEWNSAEASLRRIDEIKRFLSVAAIQENCQEHFKYLKALWKELHPVLSGEKKISFEIENKKLKISEKDYHKRVYLSIREKIALHAQDGKNTTDIINILDDWELELRDAEQNHRINIPMGKDARFAMGRR